MAINLNGSTQYINFGNNVSIDYNEAASCTSWVYLNVSATYDTIYGKQLNSGTYRGYQLTIDSSHKLEFKLVNTWPTNNITITDDNAISTGAWHHVAITYDGSQVAANVEFYIDGIKSASKTTTYDTLSATTVTTDNLLLGNSTVGVGHEFNGYLFDSRIYKRELTEAEVITIYNSQGNDNITNNLSIRALANENATGQTAVSLIDVSASGLTGSPVASPTYIESPLKISR